MHRSVGAALPEVWKDLYKSTPVSYTHLLYGKAKELVPVLSKDAITKLIIKQAVDQLNSASTTVAIPYRGGCGCGLSYSLP